MEYTVFFIEVIVQKPFSASTRIGQLEIIYIGERG